MTKIVLIVFSSLTLISGYMTYSGTGLQEVKSIEPSVTHSVRSHSSGSSWSSSGTSGGYSYGK
jgi:hypothetical protein